MTRVKCRVTAVLCALSLFLAALAGAACVRAQFANDVAVVGSYREHRRLLADRYAHVSFFRDVVRFSVQTRELSAEVSASILRDRPQERGAWRWAINLPLAYNDSWRRPSTWLGFDSFSEHEITAGIVRAHTWGFAVPYWFLLTIFSAWPLYRAIRWRRGRCRPGVCRQCGYDLRATPNRCPECGTNAKLSETNPAGLYLTKA